MIDINECAVNRGICGANKKCNNTKGSYTCQCKSGFRQLPDNTCQGRFNKKQSSFVHIYIFTNAITFVR